MIRWKFLRMWLSGRASPCQGEGRRFESGHPLQEIKQALPRGCLFDFEASSRLRFRSFAERGAE
jgi:hypothetical protein